MPLRDRLRQRAIVSLLRTHDGPPTILASQLFFLYDVEPHLSNITADMTVEKVVVEVGKILHSRQRFLEDVEVWARSLCKQAGLSFNVTVSVPAALSVVPTQPAILKTVAPSVSGKRRTRRVYLDLAINLLEKGSCTHKELVDTIMKQFPNLNRETVATFAYDIQNKKYSPIKDRKVVKLSDGRLIFEDKIKPALTVIENPNFAGTDKTETEPVTDTGKQATSSIGDV